MAYKNFFRYYGLDRRHCGEGRNLSIKIKVCPLFKVAGVWGQSPQGLIFKTGDELYG